MSVSTDKIEETIRLFRDQGGIMRTAQALDAGISPRTLYHMRDEEYLIQLGRGLFQLKDKEPLSNPDVVFISRKIPEAVVCLISALDLHEMTDEIPHQVHIALPRTSRNPILDYPPVHIYRFSDKTRLAGVETKRFDGISVKVFNPAKTIADCFKFRNQIGLDVAIEALQRGIKEGKASFVDILKYAKLCSVEKVIKPYLETLAHGS